MQANNPLSTAILIFARSSKAELQYKPFGTNSGLFDTLNEHALQTVKKTGLPYYHLTETQQKGDSFGERFTNAIQEVFNKGYDSIITVGNDSPNLEKEHFEKTFLRLARNESVIGPSADGGFYLLGVHRHDFKKIDFENLTWQSSRIKEEVIAQLNCYGRTTYVLPTLYDIDTFWDTKTVQDYSFHLDSKVSKAILAIQPAVKKVEVQPPQHWGDADFEIFFNKGSPSGISL